MPALQDPHAAKSWGGAETAVTIPGSPDDDEQEDLFLKIEEVHIPEQTTIEINVSFRWRQLRPRLSPLMCRSYLPCRLKEEGGCLQEPSLEREGDVGHWAADECEPLLHARCGREPGIPVLARR